MPSDGPDAHPAARAVRCLAAYDAAGTDAAGKAAQAAAARGLIPSDPNLPAHPLVRTVAGYLGLREGDPAATLRACHPRGRRDLAPLEHRALCVRALLGLNRPEEAAAEADAMARQDEDHVLSRVAGAWAGMFGGDGGGTAPGAASSSGGGTSIERAREAVAALRECGDRLRWTRQLHAWTGTAELRAGRAEEAAAEFAAALARDAEGEGGEADAVAGAIVAALHLGRPTGDLVRRLSKVDPHHNLLSTVREAEAEFKRAAAELAGGAGGGKKA